MSAAPTPCPFTDPILVAWWPETSERTRSYCRRWRSDLDPVSLLWRLFDARIQAVEQDADRLAALIREALEEGAKAETNYRFMVERAADEKLDGYRELGARAADAENAADGLRARLSRAVRLLHMLDRQDARHPDVAAFLDEFDSAAPQKARGGQ